MHFGIYCVYRKESDLENKEKTGGSKKLKIKGFYDHLVEYIGGRTLAFWSSISSNMVDSMLQSSDLQIEQKYMKQL